MRALLLSFGLLAFAACLEAAPQLLPSNLSAPFCYQHGGVRRWPILASPLPGNMKHQLKASHENKELAHGERLEIGGLVVTLSREGWLEIQSATEGKAPAFELEIKLDGGGVPETQ